MSDRNITKKQIAVVTKHVCDMYWETLSDAMTNVAFVTKLSRWIREGIAKAEWNKVER